MKARNTDEKPKNKNAQARVSAKKSSGNGPRGRDGSSVRGRESGQVRGEDAGGPDNEQGISNRSSRQEGQRQLKVAPGRAKTKSSRTTNQRRAS